MQMPENKDLITISVVIFVLVVFVLVILPTLRNMCMAPTQTSTVMPTTEMKEQFNSQEMPEVAAPAMPEAVMPEQVDAPVDANMPYVDSKTGTLIDGPGFEKQEVDDVYREPSSTIPSNYYFLDDGAGGEMSIQHNLCSRSCCSEQWPTPKFDGRKRIL